VTSDEREARLLAARLERLDRLLGDAATPAWTARRMARRRRVAELGSKVGPEFVVDLARARKPRL
jgi:hypothetical protein